MGEVREVVGPIHLGPGEQLTLRDVVIVPELEADRVERWIEAHGLVLVPWQRSLLRCELARVLPQVPPA